MSERGRHGRGRRIRATAPILLLTLLIGVSCAPVDRTRGASSAAGDGQVRPAGESGGTPASGAQPEGPAVRIVRDATPVAEYLKQRRDVRALTATDDAMRPRELRARRDERVAIHFRNAGRRPHNLIIPEFRIVSRVLQPGEENFIEFTANRAGRFPMFSDAPGSIEPGLQAELIVE